MSSDRDTAGGDSSESGAGFAAAITCIDGRVHRALTAWVQRRFGVAFVDLVTYAGADLVLCCAPDDGLAHVRHQLRISVEAHETRLLVLAGHADCAANPVPDATHREHVLRAVERARAWAPAGLEVVGAWVDRDGHVEEVGAVERPSGIPPRVYALSEEAKPNRWR